MKSARNDFPDMKTINNVTLVDGDWVENKWIIHATHAASGIDATQLRELEVRFAVMEWLATFAVFCGFNSKQTLRTHGRH